MILGISNYPLLFLEKPYNDVLFSALGEMEFYFQTPIKNKANDCKHDSFRLREVSLGRKHNDKSC